MESSQKKVTYYIYSHKTVDTGQIFNTIKEAAESVNGNWRAMSRRIRRGKKFKGYIFKYV